MGRGHRPLNCQGTPTLLAMAGSGLLGQRLVQIPPSSRIITQPNSSTQANECTYLLAASPCVKFVLIHSFGLTMRDRSRILPLMNKLSTAKRVQIVSALVEGNSLRSVSRMADVSINTVTKLLVELGSVCAAYHDKYVRGIDAQRIQCDEIWAFVGAKQKNVPEEKIGEWGDVWTWTAIDADSKIIVSYIVGPRSPQIADDLINDVAGRINNQVQLTTDGLQFYPKAVERAFGAAVDYAF